MYEQDIMQKYFTPYPPKGSTMNKHLIHLDATDLVRRTQRLIERLETLEECTSQYRLSELQKALRKVETIAIELVSEANK